MTPISSNQRNHILRNSGFIIGFSILFCWLPIIGPFFAGLLGAKRASDQENALYCTLVSAIIMAILMFILAPRLTGLPVQGAIARSGKIYFSLSFFIPLLIGGILGYSREK